MRIATPADGRITLQRIAQCESGGNPAAVSPSGEYRGKYQFSRATWRAMGGTGDPAQAPEAEQDQRAAALLAQAPGVFLLDEPTNHLDPHHQLAVLDLFRALARAGSTVIATLHDPTLAARFAETIAAL